MAVRLRKFEITNLFGQYNNTINVKLDDRITAVIGPNGRGKTICLKLINSLYHRNFWPFTSLEYDEIIFEFDNDVILRIKKTPKNEDEIAVDENDFNKLMPLSITLSKNDNVIPWQPTIQNTSRPFKYVSRHLPFLNQIGPNIWVDERSGERFAGDSIIEKYGDMLPQEAFSTKFDDEPELFTVLFDEVECHLIETQRLLNLNADENDRHYYGHRNKREPNLVVKKKAITLRTLIQRKLTEYAALSQRLDRTFPHRVIQDVSNKMLPLVDVSTRLQDLESKRKELESAGILDIEDAVALPENVSDTVFQLLSVYVQDTETKLNIFSELLSKIDLFKQIIDELFIDKMLIVDKNNGFMIVPDGERKGSHHNQCEIPLEKLSSGEQHQIILVFELLFEISTDSLILVDEPELSLHVGWQKKFIDHLTQIIELSGFDVILATHSPQLIGRWKHLMEELADVEN